MIKKKGGSTPWPFCVSVLFCASALLCAPGNALCTKNQITLTDALDRKVTITLPVERAAFTGVCLTDIFSIAGVWDKITAREIMVRNPTFYPGITELTPINTIKGNPYSLNFEKILTLDIDCLLTFNAPMPGFEEMNDKIKSHIPVVALDLFDHDTIKSNFEIIGGIFGNRDKISNYMVWYEGVIKKISDKTFHLTARQKKRYFIKWSWGKVDAFTTMSDSFIGMATINKIAGGINVAADLKGHGGWVQSIDPEWLTEQDIDVLICEDSIANGFGSEIKDSTVISSYRQELMELPFLASVKAVKNGDVYMMSPHFLYTPAFVISLSYLAKWFHPELFEDFDPRQIHQQYINRFMNQKFNLDKQGIFIYPE